VHYAGSDSGVAGQEGPVVVTNAHSARRRPRRSTSAHSIVTGEPAVLGAWQHRQLCRSALLLYVLQGSCFHSHWSMSTWLIPRRGLARQSVFRAVPSRLGSTDQAVISKHLSQQAHSCAADFHSAGTASHQHSPALPPNHGRASNTTIDSDVLKIGDSPIPHRHKPHGRKHSSSGQVEEAPGTPQSNSRVLMGTRSAVSFAPDPEDQVGG
jgi:hypothetical protein